MPPRSGRGGAKSRREVRFKGAEWRPPWSRLGRAEGDLNNASTYDTFNGNDENRPAVVLDGIPARLPW